MVAVLDQTDDVSRREIYKFAKLYAFPTYVKQASPADTLDPQPGLASTAFADTRRRQFKCSTKAATWVSYLFFLEKKSEMDPKEAGWTQQRLDRFAQQWAIIPDIAALREKHAELHKDALPDSSYMIVWASEDGSKERKYPLRNAMEVKQAAAWFSEHRDHFAYKDRQTMAVKLLEKANELGAALDEVTDDLLEKQAGRGTFDPATAAQAVCNRVLAANTPPEFREPMQKLAENLRANPHLAQCPTTVQELCATVDTFDRMTKLAQYYSEKIPRPEDIFCSALYKVARAAVDESCTLVTGTVYNRADFDKVALSDMRDAFGNDIADEMATGIMIDPEKMAEVVSTLPLADAKMLDRVLADAGIYPMMKTATAVKGPSFDELKQLAGMAH